MKLIPAIQQIFLKICPYFLIIFVTILVLCWTPSLDEEIKLNDMSYLVNKKIKNEKDPILEIKSSLSKHFLLNSIIIFITFSSVLIIILFWKNKNIHPLEIIEKNKEIC